MSIHLLFISSYCEKSDFNYIRKASLKKPRETGQKYLSLFVNGLKENNIETLYISEPPINRDIIKKRWFRLKKRKSKDIEIEYIPICNFFILKNLVTFFSSILKILKILKKHKNEEIVFFIDALGISLSLGAIISSKIKNKKIIGLVTDIPTISAQKSNIVKKFNFYLLRLYDGYVFLTPEMNSVINNKKKPFIVIEGSADIALSRTPNQFDKNNTNKRICLYAGGLYYIYGIIDLIEAFLKANVMNSELHLYGAGDCEKEIIEYSKKNKNIKYFGMVPNEEIVKAECEATLLVNPRPSNKLYTQYSFPSKTIEYMASGTPVLTTKLPGIPEDYYPYLFFIEKENVEELSIQLNMILNLPSENLKRIGNDAKKFVLKEKNNVKQCKKLIGLIENVQKS